MAHAHKIETTDFTDMASALEIVLDLAKAEFNRRSFASPEQLTKTAVALAVVEDFAVNQCGDD